MAGHGEHGAGQGPHDGMPRRGGFAGAVGLLTVVGGASPPTEGSVAWFPVVGAAIGATLAVVWWATWGVFPAAVSAAIVIGLDLGLTGMLHADGLIDSADGLLAHMETSRRLEVMVEPGVGAFGIAAFGAVLLLRFGALASLQAPSLWRAVLLLGGIWAISRSIMALATVHLHYARPGGLATGLIGSDASGRTAWASGAPLLGVVAGLVALGAWSRTNGLPAGAGELVAAGAVFWLAVRRIGGYTGDVLGAAGYVGEALALALATAKW